MRMYRAVYLVLLYYVTSVTALVCQQKYQQIKLLWVKCSNIYVLKNYASSQCLFQFSFRIGVSFLKMVRVLYCYPIILVEVQGYLTQGENSSQNRGQNLFQGDQPQTPIIITYRPSLSKFSDSLMSVWSRALFSSLLIAFSIRTSPVLQSTRSHGLATTNNIT